MTQPNLFADQRLRMDESISMTVHSLNSYGPRYDHWAIAWSGGKDSTTLLTLLIHLLETGQVARPKTLTVCYADTRMELTPLAVNAQIIIRELKDRGIDVRTVMAPLDKRFLVYILGRGVPPPNNNTLRWCTRQIKVDPMESELKTLHGEVGKKVLMLTGVRQGESAIRDGRIAMSCGRDGGECGQGWYQQMEGASCATLAPILHWRVCHVWDWLMFNAPGQEYGGWPTAELAEAYGGDEAQEINARTGCIGCPLAQRDTALDTILENPRWAYLSPLKDLRSIYRDLREPQNRLRKPGGETRKDGTLVDNQHRMGPLTFEARRNALARLLNIQARINVSAIHQGRPLLDILNAEEVARIEELIAAGTWPNRWTGDEPIADQPYHEDVCGGQMSLFTSMEVQP
ncbi:MAG: phosphoadenosine phosphosulfate reductase family protein [Armatimonadota bacterium]|nr:phosphoadenosine phosphosulfate reductase family protein [Armatimonadota bacterium]